MTLIQVHSDKQMRGRVMSFVAMAFFGMLPVGSLLIGIVSQQIGAPNSLLFQGIIAIIIAVLFSNFLRRDYVNKKEMVEMEEVEVLSFKEV